MQYIFSCIDNTRYIGIYIHSEQVIQDMHDASYN